MYLVDIIQQNGQPNRKLVEREETGGKIEENKKNKIKQSIWPEIEK